MNDPLPIFQVRRAGPNIELLDDPLIQAFFVKNQRHFVDPLDVFRGDNGIFRDITKMGDLVLNFFVEQTVGAAEQDVGLDSQSGQLFDAVLGRLGFELAAAGDVRHQGQMNVENVFAAPIPCDLAHGLEKRQTFNVADRAADFADGDVGTLGGRRKCVA